MANSDPAKVTVDHSAKARIVTPRGYAITVDTDNLCGVVRGYINAGEFENAARAIARVTGLRVTIETKGQFTCDALE